MNLKKYVIIAILCIVCSKIYAQENYVVEPFRVNSIGNNEIFALYFQNGIIFCSDRRPHFMVNRTDDDDRSLFQLFFVPNNDLSSSPELLSKNFPINTHKVTCSVSADGNEMYFAANDQTGQRIFSARRLGNEWVGIQPFTHNRANFTTTHPSISRDGTRLFFASDMPGGYGGFDIYVSERTPRGWGPPQNLGPEINTAEDELYPFIKGNGDLFFSSSAHGSMGGLDIFSARQIDGVWGFVQRLEEPINSIGDDIAFTASDFDGTSGFFASNRDGQNFNIYSFSSLFPVFSNCKQQEINNYTYIFFDEAGQVPDSVTMALMWDFGDGEMRYGEEVRYTFPGPGTYEIFLSMIDMVTNEISHQVADYELDVMQIEQPYITAPETVEAGSSVSFDASNTHLPDIEIIEYYWIFGDGARQTGIKVDHTYTVPGTYRVQLGVIGKQNNGELVNICVHIDIIVL